MFTVSFIMPRFMEDECLEVMRPAETQDDERVLRGKIKYKRHTFDLFRKGNSYDCQILAMVDLETMEEAKALEVKLNKVDGIDAVRITDK